MACLHSNFDNFEFRDLGHSDFLSFKVLAPTLIHIRKKFSNIRHKCSKLITKKFLRIWSFGHHAQSEHYAALSNLSIMLKLNIMT